MKPSNNYLYDMLGFDTPGAESDLLWRACFPTTVTEKNGAVFIRIPFAAQQKNSTVLDPVVPRREEIVCIRAYGAEIIRLSLAPASEIPGDTGPMLEMMPGLLPTPLVVRQLTHGWEIIDERGYRRMLINNCLPPTQPWGDHHTEPPEAFDAIIYPDGKTAVPFLAWDLFDAARSFSLPLAFIERAGKPAKVTFSLHAAPGEKFAGTGERFARLNLAGETLLLRNEDGTGVNNRRTYKNIPFYLSSKGYGLLMHTSAHILLSLAGFSTRAAQAVIDDDALDLFFIGGDTIERLVFNYRALSGFPKQLPVWSYGTWMSRMSYFSAEETRQIARRLREGGFPCDVLHLDTGWFAKDWVCEWEFSPVNFPDPPAYMREMRDQGFRITLWQMPSIGENNMHWEEAKSNGYIAPRTNRRDASNFSDVEYAGTLDFSNPATIKWYQGRLERLLKMGAVAIKTDFGEEIDFSASYHSLPAGKLQNLYALLYQRAAFEITEKTTGEGIIWARAGWTGCQRYPLHWGGDAACTWDGMAATIRGGLHIGLSGFAFWSHDVPGFHGVPNFMSNRPADDLYVRWTQMGVFTSHFRYHGTTPREPYEYPNIADTVREWWHLRYCLIPYLLQQSEKAVSSGLPIFRALIFHHQNDPTCWNIDDQFYCGENLLVAPVMNSEGIRDVYLPEGSWTDFWTGEVLQGGRWLYRQVTPLQRLPLYAKTGSSIPIYPEIVQCTDEMDMTKVVNLTFDSSYQGLAKSLLREVVRL